MADWMNDYLDTVRAQLRWKLARPVVLRELESHLQDQFEAYINDGLDETQAQAETIRQMGDPVAVGKELDRVHRPKNAWEIIAAMALLMVCGLCLWVFVFYRVSGWSLNHWLWTPLGATLLGCACCALLARLDMNALSSKAWFLYGGGLLIMVGAMLYSALFLDGGWVQGINYLGNYAAVLLPVAYGGAVYALRDRGGKGLLLSAAALVPTVVLCWMSHSFWSLLCLGFSAAALLLTANRQGSFGGKKRRNAVIIFALSILPVLFFLILVRDSLAVVFSPLSEGLEMNFLQRYVQGLLRHSRAFGPGNPFYLAEVPFQISANKNQLLLNDVLSTDLLLAGVSYLCGWAIALALLLAVVILLALLLRQGRRQRTLWGRLISLAVLVPLLVQTAGYVLVNLGFPLSSFRLPLLSYGGKFRVLDLSLLGLLLAAVRCRTILRDCPRRPEPQP